MENKKLAASLYLKNGKAVKSLSDSEIISEDPVTLAKHFGDNGADEILLFDLSNGDQEHEASISLIKEIAKAAEIPVIAGGNINRVEDVKKLIYAGCQKAMLNLQKSNSRELIEEVSKRFGKERIAGSITLTKKQEILELLPEYISTLVVIHDAMTELSSFSYEVPVLVCKSDITEESFLALLQEENVAGVTGALLSRADTDFMGIKQRCKQSGILVNAFESKIKWADFKLNGDGHIPVIVQDYKTDGVLMLAYMNEEAFQNTITTGKMTYYSRSRQELWVKGLTSGHFQYVKSLTLDCDNDTILAKVSQVGAACHTGKKSCFFQPLVEKEVDRTNPLKVFEDVYAVIADRKQNPKEGSYTNYLFDKGIDKILKKVGEEATEIVIAAKNPDPEEIKYEVSDFLYHVMVLMVERGVSWDDITRELARR